MRHRRSVRQLRNANCWSNLWELLGSQDRDGTRDRLQQVVKPVFSNTLLRGLRTYVAAPPTAHGDGSSQVGVIARVGGQVQHLLKRYTYRDLPIELPARTWPLQSDLPRQPIRPASRPA